MYRFTDGSVLCGSCNATGAGLGLNQDPNIETACLVPHLDIDDEIELKKLADTSIRVTDEVYEEFKEAIAQCPPAPPYKTNELDIYQRHLGSKKFLLSDLPVTKNPEAFISAIANTNNTSKLPPTIVADSVNYRIRPSSEEDVEKALVVTFCQSPFVEAIASEIRARESMSFGAVSSFVHDRCRDVPVPYRSDVKERVNTLYNWLCFFFEDLTWSVPGARSQIIRSNMQR